MIQHDGSSPPRYAGAIFARRRDGSSLGGVYVEDTHLVWQWAALGPHPLDVMEWMPMRGWSMQGSVGTCNRTPQPVLKEIILSQTERRTKRSEQLVEDRTYMVLTDEGMFLTGVLLKQWFGLSLWTGSYWIQLDSRSLVRLWEIDFQPSSTELRPPAPPATLANAVLEGEEI